jgi:hypothetical protein
VIACAVSEETVLLDLASGIYFGLDPVGSTIWEMLAIPRRAEEIRDELLKEYEIAPEACEREVLQFLGELSKRELIVLDARGE